MYEQFMADFQTQHPEVPKESSIALGLGIKQIRLRVGMTQEELAKDARMKLSALNTLENNYAEFTRLENLDAIARALDVKIEDIIMEARERFPTNFFPIKVTPPRDTKTRKKKRRPDIWLQRKALRYKGFHVYMNSPAMHAHSHFCFCLIEIDPEITVDKLQLPYAGQVSGFVQLGSLRIIYDKNQEYDVPANQGFTLRGDKSHKFINVDKENKLRLFLTFAIPPTFPGKKARITKKSNTSNISIGDTIKNLRHLYSPSNKPLSLEMLCQLTGIQRRKLDYIENTNAPEQVIAWDKIDKITRALNMPLEEFLQLSRGYDNGYVRIARTFDRALIDYQHYIGVKVKSALLPSSDHDFHLSEVSISPNKGIRRKSWERKDSAMISVYVEDGVLNIHVGKARRAQLRKNESLYFDASLGYLFTNPDRMPCKFILASYPAIIF